MLNLEDLQRLKFSRKGWAVDLSSWNTASEREQEPSRYDSGSHFPASFGCSFQIILRLLSSYSAEQTYRAKDRNPMPTTI